jgi:type 1 fimbria pilin
MKKNTPYRLIFFVIILSCSANSHAWECDVLTSAFHIELPNQIEVQRDDSYNKPLTDWVFGGGVKDLYKCRISGSGGSYWNVLESSIAAKAGGFFEENGVRYNIFKTNLSGVGIILRVRSKGLEELVSYYSFPYGVWQPGSWYSTNLVTRFGVDARLIKTGPIDGGQLDQTLVGNIRAFGRSSGAYYYPVNITVGSSQIRVMACSVSNPVVSVDFKQAHAKSDFKGVGYKFNMVNVPFYLHCNEGAKVNVTVNADEDSSLPDNGLIKISQGEGKATGLAIQVMDNKENGIKFGKQFFSGVSKGGLYDLGLKARYVQTSERVSPGEVNGIATITLSYQ